MQARNQNGISGGQAKIGGGAKEHFGGGQSDVFRQEMHEIMLEMTFN